MKPSAIATALLSFVSTALASASTETSKVILPTDFKPPQVFKNANLVHVISLEKNYVKEQINVLVENVASEPQTDYYVPFTADQLSRVGGFEVKDRKDASAGPFAAEVVEYDALRYLFVADPDMYHRDADPIVPVMSSTTASNCPLLSSPVLSRLSASLSTT